MNYHKFQDLNFIQCQEDASQIILYAEFLISDSELLALFLLCSVLCPTVNTLNYHTVRDGCINQFEFICKLWVLCFKSFHLSDIYLKHFYPRFRHYCAKYFGFEPKIGLFIGFNVKLYGGQSRPRSMGQGRPVCQK